MADIVAVPLEWVSLESSRKKHSQSDEYSGNFFQRRRDLVLYDDFEGN
jgi:hypothetical protein